MTTKPTSQHDLDVTEREPSDRLDARPSIAELQRIERAMGSAPWNPGESPADDGEVCAADMKRIAKIMRAPVAGNTVGISATRNAAPVLLEIAAAALALMARPNNVDDGVRRVPAIEAFQTLACALAKVRP